MPVQIVIDTNVLVAAARSRAGASFAIISSIPAPEFQPCLSVGLYTEWQDVLTRPENLPPGGTREEARRFLRYLAGQSHLGRYLQAQLRVASKPGQKASAAICSCEARNCGTRHCDR